MSEFYFKRNPFLNVVLDDSIHFQAIGISVIKYFFTLFEAITLRFVENQKQP